MFLSISLKERLDLILNIGKRHLYGTTSMQMLSLEGSKQGICCSIYGQVQFLMQLSTLCKVAGSVEVRSVGVTKGAAIDRILGEIVHSKRMVTPIDYVLCVGHFLGKDEDIYTFFEPELPSEPVNSTRTKTAEVFKSLSAERRHSGKPVNSKGSAKASHGRNVKSPLPSERKVSLAPVNQNNNSTPWRSPQDVTSWHEGSSVLDLKGDNYFSCAVGRKRSNARYLLNSSEDVVLFLKELGVACSHKSDVNANHLLSNFDRMR
ncbi:hypothetical protein HPP92_009094 [Vanilla planifolia]|uniref:Uncharacterized protein n=1 Tax=Vanilla planifolia TaxID=51239 RepID=A0A835R3U8_VANPL|nr:hypothetical protein HPP92_009094 [Vanilla planifolia]